MIDLETEKLLIRNYRVDDWKDLAELGMKYEETELERIIGFGYLSEFKPFSNFNQTGVLTYFILTEYTGKGLGTRIINELISFGKKEGITNYLAQISSKNKQSINFHKKHGFVEVGNFKEVGIKFNQKFDIIWMQKIFGAE